jgi:hypothetical protein
MSVASLQDVAEPTQKTFVDKEQVTSLQFVRCLRQHAQANITTMCALAGYPSNCKSRKKYRQKQWEFAQKHEFHTELG